MPPEASTVVAGKVLADSVTLIGQEAPEELKKTEEKEEFQRSKRVWALPGSALLCPACLKQLRGGRRRVQRTVDLEP